MRTALLWARWALEGLLGLFLLMGALSDIPRIIDSLHEGVLNLLGLLAGGVVLAYLGYWLVNDAFHLYIRLRPTANEKSKSAP
jgi:hypothetical protein